MMDIKDLYRQTILEHYKHPLNKGIIEDGFLITEYKNPSCGDEIRLGLKLNGDEIVECRHDGHGCSICCASASVMSDIVKGKKIETALKMEEEFSKLLMGQDVDTNLIEGEVLAFLGVKDFPARIKCATLPWKAMVKIIKKNG